MAGTDWNKICFSLVWILFLIFLGWPVAYFCAAWWVFFLPFEGLFGFVKEVTTFLEKYAPKRGGEN